MSCSFSPKTADSSCSISSILNKKGITSNGIPHDALGRCAIPLQNPSSAFPRWGLNGFLWESGTDHRTIRIFPALSCIAAPKTCSLFVRRCPSWGLPDGCSRRIMNVGCCWLSLALSAGKIESWCPSVLSCWEKGVGWVLPAGRDKESYLWCFLFEGFGKDPWAYIAAHEGSNFDTCVEDIAEPACLGPSDILGNDFASVAGVDLGSDRLPDGAGTFFIFRIKNMGKYLADGQNDNLK